jgi:serine/threonine-protein kinase
LYAARQRTKRHLDQDHALMQQIPPDIPLKPGQLFAGRYRILSLLGSGGYAYIFLAIQEDLEREVAIKVLRPEFFVGKDHTESQARFKRFAHEAKLLSKLRDSRTITMYDYGQMEGMAYMVFEYVVGQNLADLVSSEGALRPKRVVRILKQVLMSLREAHALGVLHRDIKPDNIMVWRDLHGKEQVKVLDFGIAKLAGDDKGLTQAGKTVGTPRYMAPERVERVELPAGDLYSLGLVAWELLVGRQILNSLSGMQLVVWQTAAPSLTLPPELQIPGALREIVDQMTSKPLAQRASSASDLLLALEHWDDAHLPRWSAKRSGLEESSDDLAFDSEILSRPDIPISQLHERTAQLPDTLKISSRKRLQQALKERPPAPDSPEPATMPMRAISSDHEPLSIASAGPPSPAQVVAPTPQAAPAPPPPKKSAPKHSPLLIVALILCILGALAILFVFFAFIAWKTHLI